MRPHIDPGIVMLAVYLTSRGFGYVVYKGLQRVVDWGIKDPRQDKDRAVMIGVKGLVDDYSPEILLLRECRRLKGSRNVKSRDRRILSLARREGIEVRRYSRRDIRATFASVEARNKYAIARVIVAQVPDLELWLPRPRRPWESEDPRINIFDAASLVYTHYYFDGLRSRWTLRDR
jgi:hypothetical protein